MTRTRNIYKHMVAVASALLLALSVLPACSDDEGGGPGEEEGKLYTVTLSLNPSSNGSSTSTRADNPYWGVDDNATLEEYERHINDCVVAVFDSNGDWYGYMGYNISDIETSVSATQNGTMTITNAGTDADLDNDGTNDAKLAGSATIEIPAGKYTFFAFANLKSLNTTDETSQGTTQGTDLIKELITGTTSDNEKMTISYLNSKAINLGNDVSRFDATADDKTYIPMSSYGKEITVEASGSMDITLFRMIGKVTITINNQTTETLTLNNITMGNFRRGDIFLVPYGSGTTSLDNLTQNNTENSYNPSFPENTAVGTSQPEYPITPSDTEKSITANEEKGFTFYEFETGIESQTKEGFGGSMWLLTNIDGRDNAPRELENFSFMRRNDWLNIPLVVADTDFRVEVEGLRMPIGGTPETIIYEAQEAFIPALNFAVDHAGEIKMTFTFSMEGGYTNIALEYAPERQEAGTQYTEVTDLTNNNALLYNPNTESALTLKDVVIVPDEENKASASITLTTQELAYKGTATIELMLAVTYTKDGTDGRMTIPYTITITNGKAEKEGGN